MLILKDLKGRGRRMIGLARARVKMKGKNSKIVTAFPLIILPTRTELNTERVVDRSRTGIYSEFNWLRGTSLINQSFVANKGASVF